MVEALTTVCTDLIQAGLRPSKRFQMLLVEASLLENDLEARFDSNHALVKLVDPSASSQFCLFRTAESGHFLSTSIT